MAIKIKIFGINILHTVQWAEKQQGKEEEMPTLDRYFVKNNTSCR